MTADTAAKVKGMLLRRQDRQQDIAACFGVNAGRIAEIATGKRFAKVKAAPFGILPKPTFDYKLPTPKIRGTDRQNGLNEIIRAAGRAAKNIEELFSRKCEKYKPLKKEEADHLFSNLQELGSFYFKLSQNVSNYQQGENK